MTMNTADQARIPRAMLRELYMVRVAKRALEHGVCPDCGYTFNYYHWPWITAPLGPEEGA